MEGSDSNLQQDPKPKGLIVILVGAPGSGKSTFCSEVINTSNRSWVRVCQDTIAKGKAGTKLQCLKSAGDALKENKSVFIDRCNLEKDQRSEFVKLGNEQVDVHAVVLDLPAKLCISRVAKRTYHDGNLQGGKAAAVVNRMLQKKELPKLNEGFYRITLCQNENDVKDAVKAYSHLGVFDSLPSGIYGQKNSAAKVQPGIMSFFKKVENPMSNIGESMGKSKGTIQNKSTGRSISDSLKDDATTLAFPSISTSDFQFDHDKASDIIVETVVDFLSKVTGVRLVLVDINSSHILSLVKTKAEKKNIDPNKFFTFVGDITRLRTEGSLPCAVIANAANWRLKPGGGGVNAAIFKAAGVALETATKEKIDTLTPGNSIAISLPSSSPLYKTEGVTHIIHVLGPNMNPQRPNCLKDDYVKGCNVLRAAYKSLFENFAYIAQNIKVTEDKKSDFKPTPQSSEFVSKVDEGSSNSHPLKRDSHLDIESNKKPKTEVDTLTKFSLKNEKVDQKKTWASWTQALHQIATHPEKQKDGVMEISDDFVVSRDLYPKAKKHILVISRLPGLDTLSDVRREHLPLLKVMHSVGLKWAEKFLNEDASLIFRLGYHSVPSMPQLHLHVISQDFDSTHLKNKKHWNSFTTPFFRDSSDVIDEVTEHGAVQLNEDGKILSTELRCHRCKSAHPNLPKLKSHINNCKVPFSSSLLKSGRLISAPPK